MHQTGPDAASPQPAGGPLSLVIPLYDEEGNVGPVARGLLDAFGAEGVDLQLILVDNGSRDRTRSEIEELAAADPRVELLHLPQNLGYGGGILAGMEQARHDLLGYMWGDGQVRGEDALRIYRQLIGGTSPRRLAKARRVERHDGWRRMAITRVYNRGTRMLLGLRSGDVNGCPKLFTRPLWEAIEARSQDWFLDPEIMWSAHRLGVSPVEIDVIFHARERGASKVRWRTLAEFAVNLVRLRIHGDVRL